MTGAAGADASIPNVIGGDRVTSAATESLPVLDPATGEALGHVPVSTLDEVGETVRAAKAAFPGWRATPAVQRVRVVFRG